MNLTPESFIKERKKSQPRNRIILGTLFKSKEVEAFGSGFRKAYSLCKAPNVGFSFDNTEDGFSYARPAKGTIRTQDGASRSQNNPTMIIGRTNEDSLLFWILQYGDEFTLMELGSLVNRLREHLARQCEKYTFQAERG